MSLKKEKFEGAKEFAVQNCSNSEIKKGVGVYYQYGDYEPVSVETLEKKGCLYDTAYIFYSTDVEWEDGIKNGEHYQFGSPEAVKSPRELGQERYPYLSVDYKLLKTTSRTWEMYGDCGVEIIHHYRFVVNGISFNLDLVSELNEESDIYGLVVGHICGEICSKKSTLLRAFEVMDFLEEECFVAMCEDHCLEGTKVDIRSTLDNDEVYSCGRVPHAVMCSFVKDHFCDGLVEILAPSVYVSNALSLQMVPEDCSMDIEHITEDEFNENKKDAVSYVGHQDTAEVLGVEFHRGFLTLKPGDILYVAQLTNGRLPDGTTNLPKNFIFKYVKITVEANTDDR